MMWWKTLNPLQKLGVAALSVLAVVVLWCCWKVRQEVRVAQADSNPDTSPPVQPELWSQQPQCYLELPSDKYLLQTVFIEEVPVPNAEFEPPYLDALHWPQTPVLEDYDVIDAVYWVPDSEGAPVYEELFFPGVDLYRGQYPD